MSFPPITFPLTGTSRERLARRWPLYGLSLTTPRLTLTPLADDDLAGLVDLALAGIHDPARMPFLMPWTDAPREEMIPNTLRFHWGSRAELTPEAWSIQFGVWLGRVLVGTQELRGEQFALTRSVSSGSWLGRAYQGIGIGTEIRCAVLQFAFDHLGATRAESGAFVDNPASLRVSAKLGYADGTRVVVRRPGEAAVEQRLLVTPETFVRPDWSVAVAGLDACLPLLGLAGGPVRPDPPASAV